MNTLKQNKAIIRAFMRAQYTDAKLVELLDHARAGKLSYQSCCCFIGTVTARHELRPFISNPLVAVQPHLIDARRMPGARYAENAFFLLGYGKGDELRRRLLIPLVLAEIKRRAKAAQTPTIEPQEVTA